jgi:hypothetical protein
MNTRTRHPDPVAERDWLAQEAALGQPGAGRADLLLARALRTLPATRPPPGFAAEVAALAAAAGAPLALPDGRLERVLLKALLVLLAASTLGVLAWYGGQWWALASQSLGEGAAQWALVGAGCLLLSWLPDLARRIRGPALVGARIAPG